MRSILVTGDTVVSNVGDGDSIRGDCDVDDDDDFERFTFMSPSDGIYGALRGQRMMDRE